MNTVQVTKLVGAAAVVGMLSVAPQQSHAAVVLNGCGGADFGASCSLAELIGGGTLAIGDTLFSNFTLSLFGGRAVDASVVRVDPLDVLYNPGFTLVDTSNTLRAVNGDATQNDFSFEVSVIAGNLRIKDNTLRMATGDLAGAASFAQVLEIVLTQDLANTLGAKNVICDTGITPSCANTDVTDAATFAGVAGVAITGNLDVFSDAAGVAEINSISLQFSQIPEPASLALLALGIAGMRAARRIRLDKESSESNLSNERRNS